MVINTCSSAISYAKELETKSAKFYEELAETQKKDAELFQSFSKENKRTITNTERTYYEVITDAIEGCFAFNIDTEKYTINTSLAKGVGYTDALKQAIKMEEVIGEYYYVASEQSKATLADIPRAFVLVSKKRNERVAKLKELF